MIHRLGYVQIDSIAAVERAHNTILRTRLQGYTEQHLRTAAEKQRAVFEHWTHDASFVPTAWIPFWQQRFRRAALRYSTKEWWIQRGHADGLKLMRSVHAHVRKRGPTRSRDLGERTGKSGGWWEWSPHKVALEVLWRSGRLAVAHRSGFQKAYDLFERVHPEVKRRAPSPAQHLHWACSEALTRLGVATPREIARFFNDLDAVDVKRWAASPKGRALAIPVRRERADGGTPERALAAVGALDRIPPAPDGVQLLSPFDPVVRDRQRLESIWGFFYRFEAFVPEAKRIDGYYTLPVLDGARFIGRCSLRADRTAGRLTLEKWRAEGKPVKLPKKVRDAVERLATELDLSDVAMR